jgi:cytosine/uracil/thiamine/allantoin permease
MKWNKIIIIVAIMAAFVSIGMALPSGTKNPERNLRILPVDISNQKLDSFMKVYSLALGVSCNFCHVTKNNIPDSLDFASDLNPMKENARKMISMVIGLNKTYFYYDQKTEPIYLNAVTCKTCHRGEPYPEVN